MGISTRTVAAGAAILLVLGLGPSAASTPQKGAERGVRRALIRLNALLAKRDIAVVDEFAKGEGTLLVGSEAGEMARGRDELEAHFAKIFAMPVTLAFSWREVKVDVRGGVAWLYADGEIISHADSGDTRRPYRLTAVLEWQGNRWKWRQFHGSEPAA
jgi:ketosteroid isomerase-like protein